LRGTLARLAHPAPTISAFADPAAAARRLPPGRLAKLGDACNIGGSLLFLLTAWLYTIEAQPGVVRAVIIIETGACALRFCGGARYCAFIARRHARRPCARRRRLASASSRQWHFLGVRAVLLVLLASD
jgi:hypothetical protein